MLDPLGNVRLGAPMHDGVPARQIPPNVEVAVAKFASQAIPRVAVPQAIIIQSLVDVLVIKCNSQKDPVDKFPELEKLSGQKCRELWQEYFARMDQRL